MLTPKMIIHQIDETLYLLSSKQNAKRLFHSIEDVDRGNCLEKQLMEEIDESLKTK